MEPVALQCVRPFVMDTVVLGQTGIHHREEEQITAYLTEKVSFYFLFSHTLSLFLSFSLSLS